MKYIILTIFILIIGLVISQVVVSRSVSDTNMIPYKIIETHEGFTIREYPELLVATTELDNLDYKSNSRLGFRKIAGYIFGGNGQQSQIQMTSPVQMDMGTNKSMSFYMPIEYDISELPNPLNDEVVISKQPSTVVAVISFSGWASDEVLNAQYQKLSALLVKQNIPFKEGYFYLGYNPPYQLVDRRNEVVVELVDFVQ